MRKVDCEIINLMQTYHLPQLNKCKEMLRSAYSDQLVDLILFGSVARHEDNQESDIDLLLLLKQPFDYWVEVRKTVDLLYPLQLESSQYISVKPALYADYQRERFNLYKNIKRDGISII